MTKDWVGDKHSAFVTIGASNHSKGERDKDDYYATDPKALEMLLEIEQFDPFVWECACGEGHLSEVLKKAGYIVTSTDLIDRGYGEGNIDFLKTTEHINCDIITNPPYKYAQEFVEHALELMNDGNRLAMFLKLTFLEGKSRGEMFKQYPPEYAYVSSSRLQCAKAGNFQLYNGTALAHAWFIWRKGFHGEPTIRWFN